MFGRLQILTCAGALFAATCLPTAALADELTTTQAAKQPKAVLLQPASAWNVDFADEKCRVARFFEHEEKRHLLLIDQFVPGSRVTMTLVGPRLGSLRRSRSLEVGLLGDKPLETDVKFTKVDFGDLGKAILINTSIAKDEIFGKKTEVGFDLEAAAMVERVVVRSGSKIVSFETGNFQKVAEVMNSCTKGLLELWGLEPEKHIGHTGPKFRNVAAIAKEIQKTYPRDALKDGVEGILRLRVFVSEEGKVSGCKMVQVTQTEELEGHACEMMQKADFAPARSALGEPMRSYYVTSVTYRLN